ncbi:MAG: hypothetical protein WC600_01055 [Desulfobaccales bacterium]
MKIPGVLTLRRQWVCWKLKFEDGKWKKVPVDPKTGRFASPTDPSTWGTFGQACKYYERRKNKGIMGLGFVFTKDDPFTGIDLDKCRDPETGVIEPWALEIVEQLSSYTEISPSGSGLHIIVFGVLPPGKRKEGDVEMYDSRHYFTITGNLLANGAGNAIENRPKELKLVYARFLENGRDSSLPLRNDPSAHGRKPRIDVGVLDTLLEHFQTAVLTPPDLEIIRELKAGRQGEMYRYLFIGDWKGAGRLRKHGPYRTQSEADQALANRLARLTNGNAVRVYALFKESKLFMRDKNKINSAYLARTIQKAITDMGWQPPQGSTGGRDRR